MAALNQPTEGRTITDSARGVVRRWSLAGQFAPGTTLNLDEMRKELVICVSSIREAVTRPVADDLAEMTALRRLLEPLALCSSVANGGLEWEANVTAAQSRPSRTDRTSGDTGAVTAWVQAYRTSYRGAGTELRERMVQQLGEAG